MALTTLTRQVDLMDNARASIWSRLTSSVLVLLLPFLLLMVLLWITGTDAGGLELGLMLAVWVLGLALVWRPRRQPAS